MSAHGGYVITKLVSEAIVAIGRADAWDRVPHLSATQAKYAAARLGDIEREREPLELVFQKEKTIQAPMLEAVLKDKNWNRDLQEARNDKNVSLDGVTADELRRDASLSMDRKIAIAGQAYDSRNKDAVPDTGLNIFFLPAAKIKFRDTVSIAEAELLRAELGLQAYHETFGHYPASLDQLTPGILAKTPVDPFARNTPLRYRLQNGGYLLYSIGPDGKDDGGSPIVNTAAKSDRIKALVLQGSRGDIVAGVNKN